jgi:DNA-binding transcriptional MerR regulator
VTPDTIRFYERERLLAPPERTASGYRQFDDDAVRRVRFIKGAKSLGLKLAEIRELLEIQDKGACPCGHTKLLVDRRIAQIDEEMAELRRLRNELGSLRELECLTTSSTLESAISFGRAGRCLSKNPRDVVRTAGQAKGLNGPGGSLETSWVTSHPASDKTDKLHQGTNEILSGCSIEPAALSPDNCHEQFFLGGAKRCQLKTSFRRRKRSRRGRI